MDAPISARRIFRSARRVVGCGMRLTLMSSLSQAAGLYGSSGTGSISLPRAEGALSKLVFPIMPPYDYSYTFDSLRPGVYVAGIEAR